VIYTSATRAAFRTNRFADCCSVCEVSVLYFLDDPTPVFKVCTIFILKFGLYLLVLRYPPPICQRRRGAAPSPCPHLLIHGLFSVCAATSTHRAADSSLAVLTILVQLHSLVWLLMHFKGGCAAPAASAAASVFGAPTPLAAGSCTVGEAFLLASVELQLTGILRLQLLRFRMSQTVSNAACCCPCW
jgi:hypothetical protein